jgi:hypothetical protein
MSQETGGTAEFFGYVAQAKADIDSLVEKAKALKILPELKSALHEAFQNLQSNPTTWGDPLYNTRLSGAEGSPIGTVYSRIHSFLILRYVYFANPKKGLLLRVIALPNHPLAAQK